MADTPRLPRAVREAADEAAAIEAQLTAPSQPPANPPPSDPPAEPDHQPANPPPSDPPVDTPTTDPVLLQKYRTLQGINASNLRKLRETQDRLKQLEQQLTAAPNTPPQPAPDKAVVEAAAAQLREFMGTDMLDHLDKRIRAIVMEILPGVVGPLHSAVTTGIDREQQRLEDAFYDRLDALYPNWEALDKDPTFLKWLQQVDPAAGVPLHALLRDAEDKLDADRVALFFQLYDREVLKATPRPQPQAQPSTVRAPVPTPNQPKVWTGAQIDQFYKDLQRGRYRGREADAVAIEQEIMTAQREGRVVP